MVPPYSSIYSPLPHHHQVQSCTVAGLSWRWNWNNGDMTHGTWLDVDMVEVVRADLNGWWLITCKGNGCKNGGSASALGTRGGQTSVVQCSAIDVDGDDDVWLDTSRATRDERAEDKVLVFGVASPDAVQCWVLWMVGVGGENALQCANEHNLWVGGGTLTFEL